MFQIHQLVLGKEVQYKEASYVIICIHTGPVRGGKPLATLRPVAGGSSIEMPLVDIEFPPLKRG